MLNEKINLRFFGFLFGLRGLRRPIEDENDPGLEKVAALRTDALGTSLTEMRLGSCRAVGT